MVELNLRFKVGNIVDCNGMIGVIKDILHSKTSDTIIIFVRFVSNTGQSKAYDIIEVTPERHKNINDWRVVELSELLKAVGRKRAQLETNLDSIFSLVSEVS